MECNGDQHATPETADNASQGTDVQILFTCSEACDASPSIINIPDCCKSYGASHQPATAAGAARREGGDSCNILVVVTAAGTSTDWSAPSEVVTAEADHLKVPGLNAAAVQQTTALMTDTQLQVTTNPHPPAITPVVPPSRYFLTLAAGVLVGAWLSVRILTHMGYQGGVPS
jgi:hypothetical protein